MHDKFSKLGLSQMNGWASSQCFGVTKASLLTEQFHNILSKTIMFIWDGSKTGNPIIVGKLVKCEENPLDAGTEI